MRNLKMRSLSMPDLLPNKENEPEFKTIIDNASKCCMLSEEEDDFFLFDDNDESERDPRSGVSFLPQVAEERSEAETKCRETPASHCRSHVLPDESTGERHEATAMTAQDPVAAMACLDELLSIVGVVGSRSSGTSAGRAMPHETDATKSPTSITYLNTNRQQRRFTAARSASIDESQSDSSDFSFQLLCAADRANSMPCGRLRNSFPRKPSLKTIASSSSIKRNVSFSNLEIREYNISLSDNPSCSYGPPIQLGWEYRDKASVGVDEYEESRSPRRHMSEMILSYNARRFLLLKRAGYSKEEIKEAMREVERVKRSRMVTDLLLPASKIDETFEDMIRHLKTIFQRTGGK